MGEEKSVGALLVRSIIELQELQVKVAKIDDKNHTIGVAISEVEHKLHAISELLEED